MSNAPAATPARPTHLRLVHPRKPLLTREQLAHFKAPKTWVEILELEPGMTAAEWRDGLIDADPHGSFVLVTWILGEKPRYGRRAVPESLRRKGSWVLTDRGRAYVEGRKR